MAAAAVMRTLFSIGAHAAAFVGRNSEAYCATGRLCGRRITLR
jgi:hypothetical protein